MKKIFGVLSMSAVLMMGTVSVTKAQNWNNNNGTTGAVVGATIGTVAGALISKNNPVVGAMVGGLVGAGVGYVAGSNQNRGYYQQPVVYQQQPVVYQQVGYGPGRNYNRQRMHNRRGQYQQARYRDNCNDNRGYNNGYYNNGY